MRFALIIYTLLLRLYPLAYRKAFGDEMLTVFAESLKDAPNWQTLVRLCLRELRDLPLCLMREHRIFQMPMRYKVLGGSLLVSGLVAAAISMYLWGYLFAPPSIQPLTSQMRDIQGLSGFRLDADYQLTSFALDPVPEAIDPFLPYKRPFDEFRTLFPVPDPDYRPSPLVLQAVENALKERQVELGWVNPQYNLYPTGYLFDGVGLSGEKVVLVSFSSTQISNDDYTYYEFLFRQETNGQLTELNRIHFNYHVAGIEGMTFPVIWVICGLLPILLLYSLYLLTVNVNRFVQKRQQLRLG